MILEYSFQHYQKDQKSYLMTDGLDLYRMLQDYFEYYNTQRRHQGIDDHISEEVYENKVKLKVAT